MSKALILGGVCTVLLVTGVVAFKVHVGPVTVGAGSPEEGVLTLRGQGTNFLIFPDENTLVDITTAHVRHDDAAENAAFERAKAGGAFNVNPGTRVSVLERGHPSPMGELAHVKILDGEAAGKTGWTFAELILKPAAAPASAAVDVDPCQVLTREEVERALGFAVLAPEHGAGTSCKYKALLPSQPGAGTGLLITLDLGGNARELFEAYRTSAQQHGAQITPLPGVGDAAYVFEKQARMAGVTVFERELNVRRGDTWVALTAVGSGTGSTATLTDLARIALTRLP